MKFSWLMTLLLFQSASFKQQQLNHERVQHAYTEKEAVVTAYFREKKINRAGSRIFIRAFKQEKRLEVWINEKNKETYALLHTYDISASSGQPGPKRKEGDLQVPEGAYTINHFNPLSRFHLSLGINYPNASDKILSDRQHPGSDIYIHGSFVTVGCIPLTDDKIKELYILAVEYKSEGQDKIPVHIFPAALTDEKLSVLTTDYPQHAAFWRNLKLVYDDFENTKTLRAFSVNGLGEYVKGNQR